MPITERQLRRTFPETTMLHPPASPNTSGVLVSAAQLLNPLTKQGKELLERAQAHLKAGKSQEAMSELQTALADPATTGYAHGILGGEYLKTKQFEDAIAELRQACELMPGNPVFRSNLADGLLMSGLFAEAEQQARLALQLDWNSPAAHYILGMSLLTQNAHIDEAVEHLRIAGVTLLSAKGVVASVSSGTDKDTNR